MSSVARLQAFVAVADELHFGRAAARLHLSQPSLSARIRRLEAELGLQLFNRTSRTVALTPVGQDVLREARRVLAAAESLDRAVLARSDVTGSPLRVGFTGSAASQLLPEVLKRLRRRWPDLQVSLQELTMFRYDQLRAGELDVVFGRLTPAEAPDLYVTVLLEEPRFVALWDGHPLAGRRSVRMADLSADGFITQPEAVNPAFHATWLAEQHAHGLPGLVAGEASSIQEFLNLVAAGHGVCLTPAAAASYNPWPGITYVPVRDAAPSALSVIRRRGDRDPRTTALVEAARSEAGPYENQSP